jgi:ribosomal protein L7/L12
MSTDLVETQHVAGCTYFDAVVTGAATRCPSCGAEQPRRDVEESSHSLEDELRAFLDRGDKIGAIKLYREATGVGLAEATHAVNAFESGAALNASSGPPATDEDSLEADVLNALSGNGMIAAIKLYRERTKVGLKEAKDAVEAIAARHGIAAKGGGCAGVVLLFILMIAAAIALT